jgi:hypothetical protein
MAAIKIDEDALFRAVTAGGYKLLAYHLNLATGEVVSRTLRPDEVAPAPQGPSVKPLPKLGGDLAPKKDAQPFSPPPVTVKKKLFADDDLPKKPAFQGDFFKREEKKAANPFGEEFKRESGTKRLAEIFGGPPVKKAADPFANPTPNPSPRGGEGNVEEGSPRIPAASDEQQKEWMAHFARDAGDPEIRDRLQKALASAKPVPAFERLLRQYQRLNEQWDRYFRKQALAYGEAWLATLGVEWELVER